MKEPSDEFTQLPNVNDADPNDSSWCYVHRMSIVAVAPSFLKGGSVVHLASGAWLRVTESPRVVMGTMNGYDYT